jgi:hypothetical protein
MGLGALEVVDDWCVMRKCGFGRSAGRPVAVHVLGLDIIDIMHKLEAYRRANWRYP